jgi:lipid II:glycine glycyltransferase (peptidoglycan interpeptide bridge formation enzyme)
VNGDTADQFWDRFDVWAEEARVVSSFARLSLFHEQRLPFRGGEEDSSANVIRTLDLSGAELWRDYAHKVRKNVAKANRSGLSVRFDATGELLDSFEELYIATLDRRGAARSHYFSRVFFQRLVDRLTGQFLFCHVYRGSRVVSTELVLLSPSRMYSFLGGTAADAFDDRPNDLLKHAVIEWGMEHGKHAYVLGGGYHDGDGIFRYKRSFAPRGVVPFRVGKRIYDPASYNRLIEQRSGWEQGQGRTWNPQPDYFPLYRAPLIG